MKKRVKIVIMLALLFCLGASTTACENTNQKQKEENRKVTYEHISQEKAKKIMDTADYDVILDVRTKEEYKEGHIKNAKLLPYDEIKDKAESMIKDKNATILVYCRSGNRSQIGAEYLADLGYTNVLEFGGIITWNYGLE